ncbi:hypothetical protein [Deinococcus ruber]|uniref:Uncharacterized protein n=1 Tax=Deinococcus ruber TaxID=1848197 RepID=A0A918FFH1_9DEIO|nr:hypothetical protein [Deinococcus ruber]GGR34740.1 hypothetical protein GCM10008957_51030 [Deinococcus ruber]
MDRYQMILPSFGHGHRCRAALWQHFNDPGAAARRATTCVATAAEHVVPLTEPPQRPRKVPVRDAIVKHERLRADAL